MTLTSSQKDNHEDNHGIENFRFPSSKFSYNIGVVGYLCSYEGIEPYNLLAQEIFQDIVDENIRGFLSAISVTEFVAKPLGTEKVIDVEGFKQFLVSLPIQVLEINYEIAERAGKLRSQYPSVPTPDALIVATALENNCDVFVTNDKRLKKLEVYGLTVIVLKDFVELH